MNSNGLDNIRNRYHCEPSDEKLGTGDCSLQNVASVLLNVESVNFNTDRRCCDVLATI